MATLKAALVFEQGATFSMVLRWETEPVVYRPVTAVSQTAPVRLTVPTHGLKPGWRAALVGGKGMDELRAVPNELKSTDYHASTVLGEDEIEFNNINASGFKAYAGGAHLQYNTPVDLTGYAARLVVKDQVGGATLFEMTPENGRILLDAAAATVTLTADAVTLAAQTWARGLYELEMESPSGVVTKLMSGVATMAKEILS